MAMIQLVYASRPFGFDGAMLNGILFDSRENNRRDRITGALICRQDIYLQLLEGPETAVMSCFGRILRDDRHVDVTPLLRRPTTSRLFPAWAMRDDGARSWMWSIREVAEGAVDRASGSEVSEIFQRLAREAHQPVV